MIPINHILLQLYHNTDPKSSIHIKFGDKYICDEINLGKLADENFPVHVSLKKK